MKRAILILSLLAIIWCAMLIENASAADNPGAFSAGHWTYPGQRVASNPSVTRWLRLSERAWEGRGLRPCAHPTVYLADNLGWGVAGRAAAQTCELWLDVGYVRETQHGSPLNRAGAQATLCVVIQHETGHLAGLGHSKRGIMSPEGDSGDVLWWINRNGQTRARSEGLCAAAVAAEYNRSHPLKAGRTLDGRFDLR